MELNGYMWDGGVYGSLFCKGVNEQNVLYTAHLII